MKKPSRLAQRSWPVFRAGAADSDFARRRPEARLRDDAGHRGRVRASGSGPGTLYGAIARLEARKWIEPLPADDRRRPYRLTGAGQKVLRARLESLRDVAGGSVDSRKGRTVTVQQLVRLYPRAWRERYGEEFVEMVGNNRLRVQQVIDIVMGAIDAWLSSDVRRATVATGGAPEGGTVMSVQSLVCANSKARYTTRDALIGSVVMVLATLVFMVIGIAARRTGFPASGEMLKGMAFPVSILLSMPFCILKGQPWRAQVVLVGGTVVLLWPSATMSRLI